jgi:DUF1680 family protein
MKDRLNSNRRESNRAYLLALEPDRLLAPYLREAGLEPKARPCGNWESSGLAGHTGGHYLSALSTMTASGADTPEADSGARFFWEEVAAKRSVAFGGNSVQMLLVLRGHGHGKPRQVCRVHIRVLGVAASMTRG